MITNRTYTTSVIRPVCVSMVLALLAAGSAGARWQAQDSSRQMTAQRSRLPREVSRRQAESIAGRRVTEDVTPSLTAKEAADFLLTPALLMQEAISETSVVTYPSE